jgi:hypothetical protein
MKVTQGNFTAVVGKAEAALTNEQVTRDRVQGLETWANAVNGLLMRGFWGRIKWVLSGR